MFSSSIFTLKQGFLHISLYRHIQPVYDNLPLVRYYTHKKHQAYNKIISFCIFEPQREWNFFNQAWTGSVFYHCRNT